MTNRTIYVGDLHGKVEVAEAVLRHKNDKIIFVGDYLDSYDRSVSDQIDTLRLVLDATIKEPARVIALMGNHELSYLDPENNSCSGYKSATQAHVSPIANIMWNRLAPFYFDETAHVVVTHAGVTRRWAELHYPQPSAHCRRTNMDLVLGALRYEQKGSGLYAVGPARGGYDEPGPLWCDTWAEFAPIPGVRQIFGHTQLRLSEHRCGVVELDADNYNIDCLSSSDEVLVWSPGLGLYPCSYHDL